MKNVKIGFQLGIGLFLAETLCGIPAALLHYPEYKRQFNRAIDAIRKELSEDGPKPKEKNITRSKNAFPQCKNKIGFTNE